ncbi:MAG: aminotransferase class I/II-fold pyridoxal phosphate-dependent enzyme [bacterium]|nr:aminotransferase class I/II-fold pyridoxal phosphate-dependent enzyme [bacterium]
MKIKRYYMEDWLNDSFNVKYNLSTSGCKDFYLGDFLEVCGSDINDFKRLFLGDNHTCGSLQLRNEICKSYEKVNTGEVMVSNGSSESLFTFFNELLDEGDEVVIPFPAFQCLYQIPHSIGCNVRYLNLLECKNRRLDLQRLESMVTPKTKLLIINNPHNPIGWTLSEEELRDIGEIARKNDCYLLFDEHYRYLPLESGTAIIPSGYDVCKDINEKTYATGSMIKCFGIVGIRIGWLISEPQLLSRCRDYKDYMTHTIPAVTDHIATIALENKNEIITLRKEHLLKNLAMLNTFMEKNSEQFSYTQPTGGVVCFPKLEKCDSKTFCSRLLEKYNVSLLPGFAFEVPEHFRLNFGIDTRTFQEALERMQCFIDENE